MVVSNRIARMVAGIALAALTVPAAAETSTAAATATAAQGAATAEEKQVNEKGERLICRRVEMTGSRMKSVKACHTAGEWKKIYRDM